MHCNVIYFCPLFIVLLIDKKGLDPFHLFNCIPFPPQKSLIDDGVCAPARAQQVVDQEMLPLVGERQKVFENNLETMEVGTAVLIH